MLLRGPSTACVYTQVMRPAARLPSPAGVMAGQDPATFVFLMTSLESGIKSLDVSISSRSGRGGQGRGHAAGTKRQAAGAARRARVGMHLPLCGPMQPCALLRALDGCVGHRHHLDDGHHEFDRNHITYHL